EVTARDKCSSRARQAARQLQVARRLRRQQVLDNERLVRVDVREVLRAARVQLRTAGGRDVLQQRPTNYRGNEDERAIALEQFGARRDVGRQLRCNRIDVAQVTGQSQIGGIAVNGAALEQFSDGHLQSFEAHEDSLRDSRYW